MSAQVPIGSAVANMRSSSRLGARTPAGYAQGSQRRPQGPARLLLAALRERRVLDNASGRAVTGLDGATIRALLQQLVAIGQARVVGRKRGTRYLPARR